MNKIEHKKWTVILSYFSPLDEILISNIKSLLEKHDNLLLLIKKKEGESKEERVTIFKKICLIFPNETKSGKIILSLVPDIKEIYEF